MKYFYPLLLTLVLITVTDQTRAFGKKRLEEDLPKKMELKLKK